MIILSEVSDLIKVNYNNDGAVYAFGLNKEPYIEVAEEELN